MREYDSAVRVRDFGQVASEHRILKLYADFRRRVLLVSWSHGNIPPVVFGQAGLSTVSMPAGSQPGCAWHGRVRHSPGLPPLQGHRSTPAAIATGSSDGSGA
jgi:hypothetical protein